MLLVQHDECCHCNIKKLSSSPRIPRCPLPKPQVPQARNVIAQHVSAGKQATREESASADGITLRRAWNRKRVTNPSSPGPLGRFFLAQRYCAGKRIRNSPRPEGTVLSLALEPALLNARHPIGGDSVSGSTSVVPRVKRAFRPASPRRAEGIPCGRCIRARMSRTIPPGLLPRPARRTSELCSCEIDAYTPSAAPKGHRLSQGARTGLLLFHPDTYR
jgi:hypothetical protein